MNATAAGTFDSSSQRLLADGELPAATVEQPDGESVFVFACDHAGDRIPRALGTLGLSDAELASHTVSDVGAGGMARLLAQRIDAALVLQNYSRAVIDCGLPDDDAEAIPARGEWMPIAGNAGLDAGQRAARRAEIHEPYHAALRGLLDARQRARRPSWLVTVHSYAPSWRGVDQSWHIGLGYGADARLAKVMLALLRRDERLDVGNNEPEPLAGREDYTLRRHGEAHGMPHVALRIRHDLIADDAGRKTWAGRFASLMKQAADSVPK
ncbi:MAG: N-formylglutamate amidohydrolase [Solimonas sp.]